MEGILRRTLGSPTQHTHYLEYHTRYIQQSTSTHTKHFHNIQQHTQTYSELVTKQLTNTIKHTRKTYVLTEQHIKYKDITSHSPQLRSKTLMATYKAVIRTASFIWSPLASSTSINKLQVMQNAALRTAT